MSIYLGIDIGGTAIKHGLVSAQGDIQNQGETPTPRDGRGALIDQLVAIVQDYRSHKTIDAVGIGTAGAVDHETGSLRGHSPNIADWADTPLARIMTDRLACRVTVDNDANCMALAETRLGAARGCRSVFFLTLGTGVGSAFVVDGKLWRGAHSMGGEWGHATLVAEGRRCACGQPGHVEAYASATALVNRVLELADLGTPSRWHNTSKGKAARPDAREIFVAAQEGDPAAAQAIRETTSYLATAIASAVNLLDPELVVVGGGMAYAGTRLLGPLEGLVRERVHEGAKPFLRLVAAELGNRAGWMGAALLAGEDALGTESLSA